jgi:hypothetical protein
LESPHPPRTDPAEGGAPVPGSRIWPVGITIGLVLMILVNLVFIYIAVTGSDGVVPSYNSEVR